MDHRRSKQPAACSTVVRRACPAPLSAPAGQYRDDPALQSCVQVLRQDFAARPADGDGANVGLWQGALAIAKELDCSILFQPAVGSILDGDIALAQHSADTPHYREAIQGIIRAQAAGEPVANERVCLDHLRQWPDPRPVHHAEEGGFPSPRPSCLDSTCAVGGASCREPRDDLRPV